MGVDKIVEVTDSPTVAETVPVEKTVTETREPAETVVTERVTETVSVPASDAIREAHRVSGTPDRVVVEREVETNPDS